jgi:NDP-sugar pyrophosphorylase family protein
MEEWVVVGNEGRIEHDVEIRRSILWEAVTIRAGVKVIDSIVSSSQEVKQDLNGEFC